MPPTNVAAQMTMICTPPSASMMDAIQAPEHGAQNAEIPVAIRTPRSALQNSGRSEYGPSRVRAPRSDPYAPPIVPLSSAADLIEKFDLELELDESPGKSNGSEHNSHCSSDTEYF